ncbi:Acg family FMN-binding oxidoreductase [Coleofasciculus sp. E1-EBD-02]|uniref:Acg family FMN-binding oxidoreductase n=1 Tax=Coleofasciculus sp. E1-EBD-02 TaxID=3068481 RepID=UPI0032F749A4
MISQPQARELIRLATLAPSGHNTQPWKFSLDATIIRIYPDYSRRLPIVDPDNHALFISLGCALENLLIAAQHSGFNGEVEYFPDGEAQDCLLVHLHPNSHPADTALFHAIPKRQSTRCAYDSRAIPVTDLQELEKANTQDGIQLRLFTEADDIEQITDFVKQGNRHQFNNPAFVNELLSWIRFNQREITSHQDGLIAAALGFPSVSIPRWLGQTLMKVLATPEGEAKRCEKLIQSSSALMLFIAQKHDKKHWVNLGRSFQRVALTASSLTIKHAHINMPCEVLEVRRQFQNYLGLEAAQPLLLLRIGYAQAMPTSPRRPLEEVLIDESYSTTHTR